MIVSAVIGLGVVRSYCRLVLVSLDLEGFICCLVVLISTNILEITPIDFKI